MILLRQESSSRQTVAKSVPVSVKSLVRGDAFLVQSRTYQLDTVKLSGIANDVCKTLKMDREDFNDLVYLVDH